MKQSGSLQLPAHGAILSLTIPPQLSFKLRGNLVDPKQDTSVPS
jgi:hypothetical protein